jgi:hypothetical protein
MFITDSAKLAPFLAALSVVLLLSEVFLRRFFSGRSRRAKVTVAPARAAAVAVQVAPAAERRTELPPPDAAKPPPPSAPPPEEKKTVKSALELAQERAKKRLRR